MTKNAPKFFRVIPFSKNSEFHLKSYLNIGYYFMITPFKIIYDYDQKLYRAKKSVTFKFVAVIRIAYALFLSVVSLTGSENYSRSSIKGPMKLFIGALTQGAFVCIAIQLIEMSLPRTRKQIIELVNLISTRNQSNPIENEAHSFKLKGLYIARLKLEFYILFVSIFVPTLITAAFQFVGPGVEDTLVKGWKFFEMLAGMRINHSQNITWWMKIVGLFFALLHIDAGFQALSGTAVVFFAAKTLQNITRHFSDNLENSKIYCNVLDEEVIINFRKVRKAFILTSSSFIYITFSFLFYTLVSSCSMLVYAFADPTGNFSFTTVLGALYFIWTLIMAADANSRLRGISKALRVSKRREYFPKYSFSLRKQLVMFEIGSGTIGLSVLDVFVVSYAFIASVMISMFSNATIVMQSLDTIKGFFGPPPT